MNIIIATWASVVSMLWGPSIFKNKMRRTCKTFPTCYSISSSSILRELGDAADLCLDLHQPQITFRQHVWDARLGGAFDVCAPCLNAVSHPGWRTLFLQPAVNFLQTDLLSAHRIWPRNSNSLKRVKGSDPRASACSFFPSINGEKWRENIMLFSFLPPLRSYIS